MMCTILLDLCVVSSVWTRMDISLKFRQLQNHKMVFINFTSCPKTLQL